MRARVEVISAPAGETEESIANGVESIAKAKKERANSVEHRRAL